MYSCIMYVNECIFVICISQSASHPLSTHVDESQVLLQNEYNCPVVVSEAEAVDVFDCCGNRGNMAQSILPI